MSNHDKHHDRHHEMTLEEIDKWLEKTRTSKDEEYDIAIKEVMERTLDLDGKDGDNWE